MTENKRIILNTAATYGRSIYALVCGLFSGRWALMALGQTDYGLMGVVGGLTAFIAFFNSWLSYSIARFYAYSVGLAKARPAEGLEECRRWFSIAVLIHTAVPCALIAAGYPLGMWAVREWLTIPPERVEACVWVFRFVCLSCFVGMVNVPYTAMYTAKQYIAELTVYSFATTTLNVCVLWFMVTHPGDWLVRYALWTCLLSVIPQVIICLRARAIFPECRFRLGYCRSRRHFRQLCDFAGWQLFGALGWLARAQGVMLLVNKFFGPRVNAAMTVAGSVNSHANTLSSAMIGAFTPAITTECGAGDEARMRRLAERSSKFGLTLSLLFLLPLALELREVVTLWLKEPPPFTVGLCYLMMADLLCNTATTGQGTAITAKGRIAAFQLALGLTCFLALPLAWVFVANGCNVYAVGGSVAFISAVHMGVRLWFARRLAGMSIRKWAFRAVFPVGVATAAAGAVGALPHLFMAPSIWRVGVTTLVAEAVFLPLLWGVVFDAEERAFVLTRVRARLPGRFRKPGK